MIIQGGMGAAVSDWRLARAVSRLGQLGVVSGTAINTVVARRLQDGDAGGHVRRALEHFPDAELARNLIEQFHRPQGRGGAPYRLCPMPSATPTLALQQQVAMAAFAEVFLAKEGHDGIVGINVLEKIQLANLAVIYGAMLAGVDFVLIGAGIPRESPGVLDRFADHLEASYKVAALAPAGAAEIRQSFDPARVFPRVPRTPLRRPKFLAIVGSATLATHLLRNPTGRIDGFVVEMPTAGGHNAPPRGPLRLNDSGEPIYGVKDEPDLPALRALGLPFWLAGSFGSRDKLREAQAAGAIGIQVGTAFAFCEESGLAPELKRAARAKWCSEGERSTDRVFTDPHASPTSFPFKVAPLEGTLSERAVYLARERRCDLGYLRQPVLADDGSLVYRCASEPIADYVRKGGAESDTTDRKCLCNALLANVGLGQALDDGSVEPALVTAGDDVIELRRYGPGEGGVLRAADIVSHLLGSPSG